MQLREKIFPRNGERNSGDVTRTGYLRIRGSYSRCIAMGHAPTFTFECIYAGSPAGTCTLARPDKAAENPKKRKVFLADSFGVFSDVFASHVEDPDASGEQRFLAVGMGSAGQVLVVCYTYREDGIRAISARRASRKERKQYESGVRLHQR